MNRAAASRGPTAKSYLAGYLLAMLLTTIPFALVAVGGVSAAVTLGIVFVAAIAQVLVHLRCFLHLGFSRANGWHLISLVFTAIIVMIVAAGTLWIMYNLRTNMMPR